MEGGAWKAAVHGVAEGRTQLSDFTFTFHCHALEKEMATHSSVLAWRIPGTGEPGGLPSMGPHRVGHDWSDLAVAGQLELHRFLYCRTSQNLYTPWCLLWLCERSIWFKVFLYLFTGVFGGKDLPKHVYMNRTGKHWSSGWTVSWASECNTCFVHHLLLTLEIPLDLMWLVGHI